MAHTIKSAAVTLQSSATPTITQAFTCAAGTTVLVLTLDVGKNTQRGGGAPQYNSVNMTQAGTTQLASNEVSAEVWYMLNPPTGSSYNVTVPNAATAALCRLVIVGYGAQTGVKSRYDTGAAYGGIGTDSPSNAVVPARGGSVIVDTMANSNNNNETARTQTLITGTAYDEGSWNSSSTYALQDAAASITFGHTRTGDWAQIIATFMETLAVAAPGTDTAVATDAVLAVIIPFRRSIIDSCSITTPLPVDYWSNQNNLEVTTDSAQITAVACDGTYLIVGQPGYTGGGRVRIYKRSGVNTWDFVRNIAAPSADVGFATCVDVYNGTFAIGAWLDDETVANSGAVYIYIEEGATLQQKLKASSVVAEQFGMSLSLYGDEIAIGAQNTPEAPANAGAVYSFTRSAGVWTQQIRLTSPSRVSNGYFGTVLHLSGSVLIATETGNTKTHLYRKSGSWAWEYTHAASSYNVGCEGDSAALVEFPGGALRLFQYVASTWTLADSKSGLPTSNGQVAYSPDSQLVAVSGATARTIATFRRNGASYNVGDVLSAPSSAATFLGNTLSMGQAGTALFLAAGFGSNIADAADCIVFYDLPVSAAEVSVALAAARALSEALVATDSVATIKYAGAIICTVGDTAEATDAASTIKTSGALLRTADDTASATDAVVRAHWAVRTPADTPAVTDAVAGQLYRLILLAPSDSSEVTESTTVQKLAYRTVSVTDSVDATDAAARTASWNVRPVDTIEHTDAAGRSAEEGRTAADTSVATDTCTVDLLRLLQVSLSDTGAATDTLTVLALRLLAASVTDSVEATDAAAANLLGATAREVNDTIEVSDTAVRGLDVMVVVSSSAVEGVDEGRRYLDALRRVSGGEPETMFYETWSWP